MSHTFKVKRKDGKGWWTLPHMDQGQIDGLTLGEDTDLHKHDQMYYTETEIDANIYTKTEIDAFNFVKADGTVSLTANWNVGAYKLGINVDPATALEIQQSADGNDQGIKIRSSAIPTRAGLFYCDSNGWTYIDTITGNLVLRAAGGPAGYITLQSETYIYDNLGLVFGTSLDYGMFYSSVADALQIVTDHTVDANIIAQFTDAGFELSAGVIVDSILDQDDFYSDSDTALATQQSIKAYIDTIDLSEYVKHDGTIPLSSNWDVGAGNILYIDTIRSRLATDTGLTLANRGGTGYIYIDDGSFNVGINMVPGKILDIYSPTTNPIIRMEVGETANCFIAFQDKDTTSDGQVYLGAVADDMVIFADGYQALRLTTLGVLDVANSACVLDEDAMGSDSAVHLCTQQSIKKYVDDEVAAGPGGWTYGSQITCDSTIEVLTASIPSDATEVEVILKGVSLSISSRAPVIEMGDSSGYDASGYIGTTGIVVTGSSAVYAYTDGFYGCVPANFLLGDTLNGVYRLSRWDTSEHIWMMTGQMHEEGNAIYGAVIGRKTMSTALTSIRLTVSGTGSFDAGEARVRWR